MSGSSYTYTLTPAAYTIPLLHAARYTAHTVLGIFLGTIDETTRQVIIQDAIPLLHHYTSLSPIAEAGLTLIEEEAKGRGVKLIGLYVAHEGTNSGLGRVGERILEGLKVDFEGVVGLTVDNEKLGKGEFPYTVYTASSPPKSLPSGPSGIPESVKLQSDNVVQGALDLIRKEGVHRSLVDFDDHVEESQADWIGNEDVKKAIKKRFAS